jgi:hypothetical protein
LTSRRQTTISFGLHGKIDPFNILHFAGQIALKPFRRDKKAALFNVIFTAIAEKVVMLTDWSRNRTD